jgi:heterodisulfide reductase subunit C
MCLEDIITMSQDTIFPDYGFLKQMQGEGTFLAEACFQCRKCSNGCPVSFAMDLFPDEVIRMVLLGQKDRVLRCNTIWICASCETCSTRCPNEVKIAEMMDHLKEMAVKENIPCPQPQVLELHETFLKNVKKRGRLFESTLLPAYLLKSGDLRNKLKKGTWQGDAMLGWKMLIKGRMPVFPSSNKDKMEIRRILSTSKK